MGLPRVTTGRGVCLTRGRARTKESERLCTAHIANWATLNALLVAKSGRRTAAAPVCAAVYVDDNNWQPFGVGSREEHYSRRKQREKRREAHTSETKF